MKIYFVTTNEFKAKEVQAFISASPPNVEIHVLQKDLQEILVLDLDTIVKHKALEAYKYLAVPCVVEHSGLFMKGLPGLPGGLGQVIWNKIGDRMCSLLREGDSTEATAQSFIAYCDGRHVRSYYGETAGRLAESARGDYKFNWDPIFIPEGSDKTYGEMGPEEKRATSPTIKAWISFLNKEFPDSHHNDKKN